MEIKVINIQAKEWFDKRYGNTYSSLGVRAYYDNNNSVYLHRPSRYGHDSTYYQETLQLMKEEGLIINEDEFTSLSNYCQDEDIILITNTEKVLRRKDL